MKHRNMMYKLALVTTAAALVVGCAKADPKVVVKESIEGTIDAFGAISENFTDSDLSPLIESGKFAGSGSLELKEINIGMDLSSLYGTTIEYSGAVDTEGRKASASMSLSTKNNTIAGEATLDDNILYLASSELLGSDVLSVDLTSEEILSTGSIPEDYDFFALMSEATAMYASEETESTTKEAFVAAIASTLEKGEFASSEEATIATDVEETKTDKYAVTVTGEDFVTLMTEITTLMLEDPSVKSALEPSITTQGYVDYDDYVDSIITDLTSDLGSIDEPVIMNFYVADKLLRGVDLDLSGDMLEVRFGGEEVANHFSMSMTEADAEMPMSTLSFTGNHVFDNDEFTTKMVLEMNDLEYGTKETLTGDLLYNKETGAYVMNANMVTDYSELAFALDSVITTEENSTSAVINNLSIESAGTSIVLGGSYSLNGDVAIEIPTSGKDLLTLDPTSYSTYEANMYSVYEKFMTEFASALSSY